MYLYSCTTPQSPYAPLAVQQARTVASSSWVKGEKWIYCTYSGGYGGAGRWRAAFTISTQLAAEASREVQERNSTAESVQGEGREGTASPQR